MRGKLFLLFTVLLCVLLCGCAEQTPPAASPAGAATPAPTEQLITLPDGTSVGLDCKSLSLESPDQAALTETSASFGKLPALESVSFDGPLPAESFAFFCAENPTLHFDAEIELGSFLFSSGDTALSLEGINSDETSLLASILPGMHSLESVSLGSPESSPALSLSDLGPLQSAAPDVDFQYEFQLYGQTVNSCDTTLDLYRVPVKDEGAEVFEAMKYMPRLEYLDMDSCGVSNEAMANIRDSYPNVKVVWRVWFGERYSVRTDVERILASKPDVAGCLIESRIDGLQYCTDVKLLDLGHNPDLHTIEFVRYMPKLEVAILAMDNWSDCSPLAGCTELEYLEIQTTQVSDISALSELKKLKHLNICYLYDLTDISPLYGLTELERLWIGCISPVPDEQIEKMQTLVPDCVINTTTLDPTRQGWRLDTEGNYVPRYKLLREQFGGYRNEAFSFSWNDPLY